MNETQKNKLSENLVNLESDLNILIEEKKFLIGKKNQEIKYVQKKIKCIVSTIINNDIEYMQDYVDDDQYKYLFN